MKYTFVDVNIKLLKEKYNGFNSDVDRITTKYRNKTSGRIYTTSQYGKILCAGIVQTRGQTYYLPIECLSPTTKINCRLEIINERN